MVYSYSTQAMEMCNCVCPIPINSNQLHDGVAKGQLISKCLFGVFNFSQKMNENKST